MKRSIALALLAYVLCLGVSCVAHAEPYYYWVVTAYNEAGVESVNSNEAMKDVAPGGSALLSWTPPAMNTDGTALTDLAGYVVYRSEISGGPYSEVADLGPGTTTYVDTPPVVAPQPPTDLTVMAGNLTAYQLRRTRDAIALAPVGTVAADTACEPQSVMDRNGVLAYVVPRAAVDWAGTARPEVVLARCQ